MIFLPIVYNPTSSVTFAYYQDSPPMETVWGSVVKYSDYNNSLGIIRLNSPSDILKGPMSHEIIHYYNNKDFNKDVYSRWDKSIDLTGEKIGANSKIITYKAEDPHWGYSDVNGQLGGFEINNLIELHPASENRVPSSSLNYKNYNLESKEEDLPASYGIYTLRDWSKFSVKTGNNKSPGAYGLIELYSMNLLTENEWVKALYPDFDHNTAAWRDYTVLTIYKNVKRISLKKTPTVFNLLNYPPKKSIEYKQIDF